MTDITVQELKERLDKAEEFVFIDVREPHEYEQQNLGAELIPLGTMPQKLEELKKYSDQEIVIHCRSGARSGKAKEFLVQNGFKNVRNVLGGILAYNELP